MLLGVPFSLIPHLMSSSKMVLDEMMSEPLSRTNRLYLFTSQTLTPTTLIALIHLATSMMVLRLFFPL